MSLLGTWPTSVLGKMSAVRQSPAPAASRPSCNAVAEVEFGSGLITKSA